ncbi:hypothetical protein HELRODRAFT_89217, partial [Helobdella robusta]|uniref:Origin recognition complex subunit 4 n=1 Tax=Helobdella robusta TaxID=6412 RepID=T1G7A4_HELRO
IFLIIDEFDLFLHHKNQILLYNLLDLIQSFNIPLGIIGLTSRKDVLELFEKRVKSRFSQRIVLLFFEYSFLEYKQICKNYLSLPSDLLENRDDVTTWNTNLDEFLSEPLVVEVLKKQFEIDSNYRSLQLLLLYPVSKLTSCRKKLEAKDLVFSFKLCNASDSKCPIIQGLSTLELILVILAGQLSNSSSWEPFNFEMIYQEFKNICSKKNLNFTHDKATAFKAFENICSLELLIPVNGLNQKLRREYQLMKTTVHPTQLREAINRYQNCPTHFKHWIISDLLTT